MGLQYSVDWKLKYNEYKDKPYSELRNYDKSSITKLISEKRTFYLDGKKLSKKDMKGVLIDFDLKSSEINEILKDYE